MSGHHGHDHAEEGHGAAGFVWVALAGAALAAGFFGERFFGLPPWVALGFYVTAYVAGGWEVAAEAIPGLFRGKLDTDLLMLAAAAGAAALGQWAEGAFLLFLFSLGHAGEHYALDRARNAVGALGKLMPRTARVKRDGVLREAAVETLEIGEVVVVRPGDRVPVDGVIVAGASGIDQSAITGESVPVERGEGDEVFAGTINQDHELEVRVVRLAKDNTLSRVMRLVAEAQEQRSPAQRFAESFTRWFVPAVLLCTVLVVVAGPWLLGWAWRDGFYRGMVLLVAASPCALAIGTPAAVLAGIARAARNGVLIKGGVHLENLGALRTITLDKTGTLTTGGFAVTRVAGWGGTTEDEVLRVAAAVEERSSHPLAAAIVAEAKARGIGFPAASHSENLPGRGVRAEVEGEEVLLGATRAFADEAAGADADGVMALAAEMEGAGHTVVVIRKGGRFLGLIGLADEARPAAKAVISRLRALGIGNLVMLTGDNPAVAARIAGEVGIAEVRAGLLPETKLSLVRELEERAGPVAMVGDGINDAPALAAATIGVAMGGGGTAVALETADVVLMGDDLRRLPFAVGLSRASRRVILQNLTLALGVILLLVAASLAGLAALSVVVVAHEGSTILVVLNALRLLAWKERE